MINFDVYRNNPTAAATLIAREGDCGCCPMCNKCDSAPDHDDYDKCFEMWTRFFKFSPEMLGSVNDFSDLLSIMIDCDKCIVKKLNECDFSETKDCGLTFCKWLCNEFTTTRQESRQAEPAVSFNGSFLKKLAQAAKKIEPGKEYTLTEIERLLRDSENEAEREEPYEL